MTGRRWNWSGFPAGAPDAHFARLASPLQTEMGGSIRLSDLVLEPERLGPEFKFSATSGLAHGWPELQVV